MSDIPIKIQFVKTLSNLKPSRIIAVKADGDTSFALYITDKNSLPFPLKESAAGIITAIQNTDGNLVITGASTKTINVSPALMTLINSALQPGDNVSELTNDANYITLADVPTFEASDYDLEDFTNTSLDPFVRSSEIIEDIIPTLQQVTGQGATTNIPTTFSAGVSAISNEGIGVYVNSDNGVGIDVSSNIGTAISAYSNTGTGLNAVSSTGSGIFAFSSTGTGLTVVGNTGTGVSVTSLSGLPLEVRAGAAVTGNIAEFKRINAMGIPSTVASVNTDGATTSQSFIKSGGLSTEILMADGSVSTATALPLSTATVTELAGKISGSGTTNYIPKFTASGTVGDSPLSVSGSQVSADGGFDIVADFSTRGNLRLLNKIGDDWLNFATRNTSGLDAVFDLERIGNITIDKTSLLKGKINQNYTALVTDPFYDAFLSTYSSDFSGYNYHAIRSGSGTGGAIGAANNSTGTGSAIIANRYAGGQGNGVEGSKVGPESGDGVFGINSGGGSGNGTSGVISGSGSGHAIYGYNINGSGNSGYFLGGNGVRIISKDDLSTSFSLIAGGATTTGLVVNANGNTGIGVFFPSEKLEVNGNIKATSYNGGATLTGTPTAPTAAPATTGNQIATLDYVLGASNSNIAQTITNGVTTSAPSQDAVFDAMAGKANLGGAVFTGTIEGLGASFQTNQDYKLNSHGTGLVSSTFGGFSFVTKVGAAGWVSNASIEATSFIATTGTVRLKSFTVATLPSGVEGDTAYVTDALAPSYLVTVVGGGSIKTAVFYNGTNWVSH